MSHLGFLSPWGMRSCEVQCISPGSRPPGLLGKGTITLPVPSLPLYTDTPMLDAESMGSAETPPASLQKPVWMLREYLLPTAPTHFPL